MPPPLSVPRIWGGTRTSLQRRAGAPGNSRLGGGWKEIGSGGNERNGREGGGKGTEMNGEGIGRKGNKEKMRWSSRIGTINRFFIRVSLVKRGGSYRVI